jgi:hypothetical protein
MADLAVGDELIEGTALRRLGLGRLLVDKDRCLGDAAGVGGELTVH